MGAFVGGIHPNESKERTSAEPITDVALPKSVVIPLQQHIGAPCKALVKKKAQVTAGQPIGEPQGFVSAAVHSSVTGTVTNVGPEPHPSGKRVEAVTIDVDVDSDEWPKCTEWFAEPSGADGKSPDEILSAVASAGIVGMGGAGFPAAVKLRPPAEKPIDVAILNGCESEPYLTSDHRLMVEQAPTIAAGMALVMRALGVSRGIVAVEDNKLDAAEALRSAAWPDGVEVRVLPTRYPQGAEKMLISALLGREVPSGGLPMDVGAVVQNVATAAAVARAVNHDEPLTWRVVTLTGSGVQQPGNYRVPFGMTVGDLLVAAGGLTDDAGAVLFGGPMMGVTQASLETPVVKTTSGIVVMAVDEMRSVTENRCLRCGSCVEACPMGLVPTQLLRTSQHERVDLMERAGILDCIECGSCMYQCGSNRQMVPWIRAGKAKVLAAKKEAALRLSGERRAHERG